MQSLNSISHVSSFLEDLVDKAYEVIEQHQLYKLMPYYLHPECMNLIELMQGVQRPFLLKDIIVQQTQKDVPKLQKDSLMPKEVENQKITKQITKTTLMYSKTKSKKPSVLSKFQQQLNTSLRSISINSKKPKSTIQSSMQRYESLQTNNHQPEDPEVQKYRTKIEIRLQYENQYNALVLQRQKSFTSKLQQYNALTQNNIGITNEYDGEQIKSSIQAQHQLKYYSMRASFAPQAKKKLEQMLIKQNSKTIDITKNRRQKQVNSKELREMQLPLFVLPKKQLVPMNDVKNYKLLQYKKHFGRKYSRLDEYSKIDLTTTINHEQNKDEVFSERKHLKDSSSLSQSMSKVSDSLGFSRKLALPRLNGKYKVLDRYQSS